EAFRRGRYKAAIEAWEDAYALDPRSELQYNLAQAYGRLGRAQKELEALEIFVAELDSQSPMYSVLSARIASLRQRIAETGSSSMGRPIRARPFGSTARRASSSLTMSACTSPLGGMRLP